jgi:hypothetical protein
MQRSRYYKSKKEKPLSLVFFRRNSKEKYHISYRCNEFVKTTCGTKPQEQQFNTEIKTTEQQEISSSGGTTE